MSIIIGYVQLLVLIIGLWIIASSSSSPSSSPPPLSLSLSLSFFYGVEFVELLIPVATQSKAWVCGCSLAGIVGSNPARGMEVCLF